jgi:tRNA wybutosine-synthesizing protein 4
VDVDYPQLIDKKRDVEFTNSLLRDVLLKTGLRTAEAPVRVKSDQYMAIGCDLRDLKLLEQTLRAELDITNSSILFVAEVSVTYMPLMDANKLIQWANTFENCTLLNRLQLSSTIANALQLASACWSNISHKVQTIPSHILC